MGWRSTDLSCCAVSLSQRICYQKHQQVQQPYCQDATSHVLQQALVRWSSVACWDKAGTDLPPTGPSQRVSCSSPQRSSQPPSLAEVATCFVACLSCTVGKHSSCRSLDNQAQLNCHLARHILWQCRGRCCLSNWPAQLQATRHAAFPASTMSCEVQQLLCSALTETS